MDSSFQETINKPWALTYKMATRNGRTRKTSNSVKQVDEYDTFEDKGNRYKPGPDYKKINVHIVYAVKHDGRHKLRLVAGGDLSH
jgi:hypothetical protein